jgi:predicted nuclease of predicted toxin-antitoxin system
MRFKIDENLPAEASDVLRRAGFDAATVADEGLAGSPDADIASICRREDRVIVTLDLGFADIRIYPPQGYAGLIVLRLMRQDRATVLRIVERLIPALDNEPLEKRLWIVDERRIRIRG